MLTTHPSDHHLRDLHVRGFYIVRGLVEPERCAAIKTALLRRTEELAANNNYGPDKLIESAARQAPDALPAHERFRKLNGLADIREAWENWYAHPRVLGHVAAQLGLHVLTKYTSAFLKPARIGGPTPWHQDIGLWRDGNVHAVNGWMAIDPSRRENGCLQVVPGSHKGSVIPHVEYDDSVHAELPRELCVDLPVEHIELEPGDALFWHSNLWHYSPPNRSEHARMGVGAVWINPAQLSEINRSGILRWAARDGQPVAFPPPALIVSEAAASTVATTATAAAYEP